MYNATIPNNEVYIKKDDIIWTLVVIKLKNENNLLEYKKDFGVDEEEFFQAIEKYEEFINYKEGHFSIVNEISYIYDDYIRKNSDKLIFDFINENINDIYNIIFGKDIKDADIIEITSSKIITRLILLRKSMFKKIIEGANNYGD